MFYTDSSLWNILSDFASNLGSSKQFISTCKRDFNFFLDMYIETRKFISKKYDPLELNASLSMQNFYPWFENFYCFYMLMFSGFRHTAHRELRFYLESSARSYFIDSTYLAKSYLEKVNALKKVRFKNFRNLLRNLPNEKQEVIAVFYHDLCEYVHLSHESQTDALRDLSLNLSLNYPKYEDDKELLKKTFNYSEELLLNSLNTCA